LATESTATTDRYVHSDPDIRRQSMVLAIPADFDVVKEAPKDKRITLSRDLVDRAIRSVQSKEIQEVLRAVLFKN
jgi:hypothetical protein